MNRSWAIYCSKKQHQGAILVFTALSLVALLGVTALIVDLSAEYLARQHAQQLADAAALAGGAYLGDESKADQAATAVINSNNIDQPAVALTSLSSPQSVTTINGQTISVGSDDSLRINCDTDCPTFFSPIVGFNPHSSSGQPDTLTIPAHATVIVQTACGLPAGSGLAPFGLIGDQPNSSDPTERYIASLLSDSSQPKTPMANQYQPADYVPNQYFVLRLNVWKPDGSLAFPGNMDPIQLNGSQGYFTSIAHRTVAPVSAGDALSIQNNATIGLTQTYLNARLSPSDLDFTHDFPVSPSYINWFFGSQADSVDQSQTPVIDEGTGQTYSYHNDPKRQETSDSHILILPIISESSPNGKGTVTVLAFAAFFVEQIYRNSSNNAIAEGRFIGVMLPGAQGGACVSAGTETQPELVE